MFTFDIANKRAERLFYLMFALWATPIEGFNVALTATVSHAGTTTPCRA